MNNKLLAYAVSFAAIGLFFLWFFNIKDQVRLNLQLETGAPAQESASELESETITIGEGTDQAVPPATDINQKPMEQTQSPKKTSRVTLKTNKGDIVIDLFAADAPKTVENFITLSKSNFYNGTRFHRVIKGFMIQGGDPNSKDDDWSNDGTGGPGYQFKDEFNAHKLVSGTLAMANSGPNTNGSQFFIVTAPATPWLDGKHTAFGTVVSGMDVVTAIENAKTDQNDHPLDDMTIESVVVAQ
jgi:cyclophilin family peptidyl-prolyl cis-trans isomerase